ncbi:MAG: DUF4197 family protein [Verrucomicrobiae bacterium]|nr:DUF4197 family protein [Verrucomicrobiae bacterium]
MTHSAEGWSRLRGSNSGNDAATQYFRRTSETRLKEKFLPIVKKATEQVGVTAAYKNLMAKAGPTASFSAATIVIHRWYCTASSLPGVDQADHVTAEPVGLRRVVLTPPTVEMGREDRSCRWNVDPRNRLRDALGGWECSHDRRWCSREP